MGIEEKAGRIVQRFRRDYADEMRRIKLLTRKINKTEGEDERLETLRGNARAALQLLFDHHGIRLRADLTSGGFQNTITKLNTDGTTEAVADVGMAFSEWSRSFVHGADMMAPIGLLATSILGEGERISGVSRITWRKPVTHNLTVSIFADTGEIQKKDGCACDGEMLTSEGRKLIFYCSQKPGEEEMVSTTLPKNPYVLKLLEGQLYKEIGTHEIEIQMRELPQEMLQELKDFPEILASTILEIITYGAVIIGKKLGVKAGYMCGIEGVTLP